MTSGSNEDIGMGNARILISPDARTVEETLRASGQAEIPADEVGLAILGPLSELDSVAYLRFASVYKHYNSVEDFETEIETLRSQALVSN